MTKLRPNTWLRKQQLWILGAGVLFLADFVFCGYWPSQGRLTALKTKKANYEQTIGAGQAKGLQLQALRARLSATDSVVRHYDGYVPPEGALGTFLSQVSQRMTNHQLVDQVVVPGKESQVGELICIPVHITGRGGLSDIFGFFTDLRSMDRLVRVDRTSLKNDGAFSGRVTMEVEVVIYYRPGKSPADAAKAGGQTVGGASHGV